jgi:hypothetical protein
MLSWVLPAILGLGLAWASLMLPFGLGFLSALSLALGLGTQMTGGVLAQMGYSPAFSVVFFAGALVVLWRWKSWGGGLGP